MSSVQAAAIYARISRDVDGRREGVERQLQDCRKLAKARGWKVFDEYVDNDLSAYSGKHRPQYERMVEDVAEGRVDAVIVYNLDRLTRRPMELEQFAQVCLTAGVRDLATVTADIDLGNDDGLFMARMYAAFAAKESGRKSERVKRRLLQRAEQGLHHGGSNRPFGYAEDRVTIVPAEAKVIRTLVARFLAGESLRSLATWLDETGVRTVRGGPWRTPTLKDQLCSPRIAGLRSINGEVIAKAQWKPIITVAQRDQVLAQFAARKTSGRRAVRRYLLTGMLRCGKCQGVLFSQARKETRRYVCMAGPDHGGCGRLTVVAEPVEVLVTEAVLILLDGQDLADALADRVSQDAEAAGLALEVSKAKARRDELADLWGRGEITRPEWLRARKPIENAITSGERKLLQATRDTALDGLVGNGKKLRAQWDTLNLTRQSAIVRAVLDHAVIAAGVPGARSLDPDRVDPVWRL